MNIGITVPASVMYISSFTVVVYVIFDCIILCFILSRLCSWSLLLSHVVVLHYVEIPVYEVKWNHTLIMYIIYVCVYMLICTIFLCHTYCLYMFI